MQPVIRVIGKGASGKRRNRRVPDRSVKLAVVFVKETVSARTGQTPGHHAHAGGLSASATCCSPRALLNDTLFFPLSDLAKMPTYEYQCEKCKKTFDLYQSMKDAALTTCPKEQCRQKTWGKGRVKRLLGTGAGLIFKGSGFYITDYRSEGYKAAAKTDSNAGSDSKPAETKGTETKSESKPSKPAANEKPKAAPRKK